MLLEGTRESSMVSLRVSAAVLGFLLTISHSCKSLNPLIFFIKLSLTSASGMFASTSEVWSPSQDHFFHPFTVKSWTKMVLSVLLSSPTFSVKYVFIIVEEDPYFWQSTPSPLLASHSRLLVILIAPPNSTSTTTILTPTMPRSREWFPLSSARMALRSS